MRHAVGMTVLGSGSRGNAAVIHNGRQSVLIDAGFSAKELTRRLELIDLDPGTLSAVVVSHEHSDHVRGLRVFAQRFGLPIFANRGTATVLRHRDSKLTQLSIFSAGSAFDVGDFRILPFSIPHDANDPVAFVVETAALRIGVATDMGHVNHLVIHQLKACDALILESNHDIDLLGSSRRPWSLKQRILSRHGHLSNAACAQLIQAIIDRRTRHIVMAHASEECNRYDLIEQSALTCLGELNRSDVGAYVARQDDPLPTVWL